MFRAAPWNLPGRRSTIPSVLPTGFRTIILRCLRLWRMAVSHRSGRAPCAITRMARGVRRMPGFPVFPFRTSSTEINDFKNGLRKSADVRKKNTNLMIDYARAMTDDEVRQAAEYFGSMKWTPWIKVVETESVPKTRISVGMFLPLEGGGEEPIRERIIEVPKDTNATEVLRNPRSGFIAYVPLGSIKER